MPGFNWNLMLIKALLWCVTILKVRHNFEVTQFHLTYIKRKPGSLSFLITERTFYTIPSFYYTFSSLYHTGALHFLFFKFTLTNIFALIVQNTIFTALLYCCIVHDTKPSILFNISEIEMLFLYMISPIIMILWILFKHLTRVAQ